MLLAQTRVGDKRYVLYFWQQARSADIRKRTGHHDSVTNPTPNYYAHRAEDCYIERI